MKSLPLILLTVVFIGIFANTVIKLQLVDIRANWNKRRCEAMVIAIAHFVPDGSDPKVDPTEFATDNFHFCMKKAADFTLSFSLSPIMDLFKVQLDATDPIAGSMNYLRSSAKSLLTPMTSYFQTMWDRMQVTNNKVNRIAYQIRSAFGRTYALILSSIFAGMSVFRGIINTVYLVISIVKIILIIMIVIMIILAILSCLIPGGESTLAIVITVVSAITTLITTALEVMPLIMSLQSVSSVGFTNLCVGQGTLVAVKDGWKRVEELKPGDKLRGSNVVEGVLKSVGGGRCVVLEGVVISDVHIVMDSSDGIWKHAGKHPLAQVYKGQEEFLYCLNTSDHTWSVKGSDAELLLRDWQEMPSESFPGWESEVHRALNPVSFPRFEAAGRGLLGKETMIWERSKGPVRISDVAIGDFVKDGDNTFTEVIGVYEDCARGVPLAGPNAAAWIYSGGYWVHRVPTGLTSFDGWHLITASGVFMSGTSLVRDFTEVGVNHELNTEYAVKFLNTL